MELYHVFLLIGLCLEPDQSTPRTNPFLPHTPASFVITFKFHEILCELKFQAFGDVLCR